MGSDDPLDLDFDPWEDTTAERPVEHQDPFDDGTIDGPFGVHAEAVGVPRLTAGTHRPRPVAGSRVTARLLVAGVLATMIGVPLLVELWQWLT